MLKNVGEIFEGRLHSGMDNTRAISKLFEVMMNNGHKEFDIIDL